jgi:hypothetical protein
MLKKQERRLQKKAKSAAPPGVDDIETRFADLLEDSDEEEDPAATSGPGQRKSGKAKKSQGRLEITEGGSEPVDFLGSESYIVSQSQKKRTQRGIEFDQSGKLLIHDDASTSSAAAAKAPALAVDDDEIDVPASDDDSDADAATRASSSAKRQRVHTTKAQDSKRSRPANLQSGDRFKSKGGGDKKVAGMDPYAYLRFDPTSLNKRKKGQFGQQFQHLIQSRSRKPSKKRS